MKILVTGANGQLGSKIRYLSPNSDYSFFCDIDEMDLSDAGSISSLLIKNAPDFIISCGAYTAVDNVIDEAELAFKINAEAPKTIAEYCNSNNTRLIHISTEYVFDCEFYHPIREDDEPYPQSVYGHKKMEGEKNILALLDNAYIIRTSWAYSTFGNNFVKTMLKLGTEKSDIYVVSDQSDIYHYSN